MMCSMGENGQTLLVPADEPPISTRNPSVPQPVPGAGGNTSFSDFDPLSHGNMVGAEQHDSLNNTKREKVFLWGCGDSHRPHHPLVPT